MTTPALLIFKNMSNKEEITVQEPITVKTVLDQFLHSHNLYEVLDTLQDASTCLHFKIEQEASDAETKEEFLSIQEQKFEQSEIMQTVLKFVSGIIILQTKNQ